MTRPSIAVIVPTVDGREAHLERCLAAYESSAEREGVAIHTVVLRNRPTCGVAWQEGADHVVYGKAPDDAWGKTARAMRGGLPDYLHFTADDLEPRPGWARAAIDACVAGWLPAPLVYGPDGVSVQSAGGDGDGHLWKVPPPPGTASPWCAIPFMPTAAWIGGADARPIAPMIPLHYYTDDWLSLQADRAGWPIRFAAAYAFTHYDAAPGRGAGFTQSERAARDRADFLRYMNGELPLESPTCESSLPAPPAS